MKKKEKIILDKIRGKKLLDIGCVGTVETIGTNIWRHKKFSEVASSAKGIDFNKEGVDKANKLGYDITHSTIEDYDTEERFEVITCVELIEHINDQNFLTKLCRLLTPDGSIIITTPNPHGGTYFFQILLTGSINQRLHLNMERGHVLLHNKYTLRQLAFRCGLELVDAQYTTRIGRTNKLLGLANVLFGMLRKEFGQSMIAELKKRS